jgi:hypothetical protein
VQNDPQFNLLLPANAANNRAGFMSGLMRKTASSKQGDSQLGGRTMFPVSGVVHIPDVHATPTSVLAGDPRKQIYNNRIKHAVLEHGAVAAALHHNSERVYVDAGGSPYKVYDNFRRVLQPEHFATQSAWNPDSLPIAAGTLLSSALGGVLSANANHSVVIVGWDDAIRLTYTVEMMRTHNTSSMQIPVQVPITVTGAFLVYDNRNQRHWLSYDTPLTEAYAIEGFIDNNFYGTVGTENHRLHTQRKTNMTSAAPPGHLP